jgi:RimJ/RimL family protein N-acetyltransferase
VVAGNIGLLTKENIYRKNIEIGYFVEEKLWGRGLASRAIMAITFYAFSRFDVVRVYAEVFAENAGSRRALEKAGFRQEAILRNAIIKNQVIRDACIYSVLREDYHVKDVRIIS